MTAAYQGEEAPTATWTDLARTGLFLSAFLFAWIGLNPFPDLRDTSILGLGTGGEGPTYGLFFLFAVACGALGLRGQSRVLLALLTPSNIILMVLIGVSVVTSEDMDASIRRCALFVLVAGTAGFVFILPSGRHHLMALLGAAVTVVLVLCYLGVIVAPQNAVHQANDVMEPALDGDWRGLFGHKNSAGALFALYLFISIALLRSGAVLWGALAVTGCAVFLVMTGSKSSLALLIVTLAVTGLASRIRSPIWRAALVFLPVFVLLLFGPMTVLSPGLASVLRALPVDATFTGRTDVWTFGFEKIAERPWIGHGFDAFWQLESTRFGGDASGTWAAMAAHSHNGYIDATLNMGFPALLAVVAVFLVRPFRDLLRLEALGVCPALSLMLFQIWAFCIYLSCVESFLFVRSNPLWFTFLFATLALRFLARFGDRQT